MKSILAASPREHAASLAAVVAAMALLRVESIETKFLNALTAITSLAEDTHGNSDHHHHHHEHQHRHSHDTWSDLFEIVEAPPEMLNWLLHFCLMAIGLELPTTFLRLCHSKTPRTDAMGGIFVFFWIHGALTVLEHSVANPVLSEKLYTFGVRAMMHFSVFMVPFVMVQPKKGWYVAPIMAVLTFTHQVSFKNWYGRVLGLASVASILLVSDFHLVFKFGFVGIALLPAMLVSQKIVDITHDDGHKILAGVLVLCCGAMVLGIRLKEHHTNIVIRMKTTKAAQE